MTDFTFVKGSTTYPGVSGTIYDNRSSLDVEIVNPAGLMRSVATIALASPGAGQPNPKVSVVLRSGLNVNPFAKYTFVDGVKYAVKLHAFSGYTGVFGAAATESYIFMYRANGGDTISAVTNTKLNEVETGGEITIHLVLDHNAQDKYPDTVHISFDLGDYYDYIGDMSSDNTEAVSSFMAEVPYSPSGDYVITNVGLNNDRAYDVNVSVLWDDGYSTSYSVEKAVHVIEAPEILEELFDQYYVGQPQTGEEAAKSTVVNFNMKALSEAQYLPLVDNEVTFKFMQDNNLIATSVKPLSTPVNGIMAFTIQEDEVVYVNSALATQNPDGSTTITLVAELTYHSSVSGETIIKTSNGVTRNYGADIVSVLSVNATNAWIVASEVAGSGTQTIEFEILNEGYAYEQCDESAVFISFKKTDNFGDAPLNLDTAATSYELLKLGRSGNGRGPVKKVLMRQGHDSLSAADMLTELLDSKVNGQVVLGVNKAETVGTQSQVFADSSTTMISYDSVKDGVNIVKHTTSSSSPAFGKKINAYFYTNPNTVKDSTNSFTMAQSAGIGMYAIINVNLSGTKLPFFGVYSPFKAGATNSASWYQNRAVYEPAIESAIASEVGLFLLYTGTDNVEEYSYIPASRRIKCTSRPSSTSTAAESVTRLELVNLLSFHTGSTDNNYDFRLIETGMYTAHPSYDRVRVRYNVLPAEFTSEVGLYANQPGPAGIKGTQQEPMYMLVEDATADDLRYSVAIKADGTTVPQATESNTITVVDKITDQVEELSAEAGHAAIYSNGSLTVQLKQEPYITKAIITGTAIGSTPFEVELNGSDTWTSCAIPTEERGSKGYAVQYCMTNPDNGALIVGLISDSIPVVMLDGPSDASVMISGFEETTFQNDGKMEFSVDVAFNDVGASTVDGVLVYLQPSAGGEFAFLKDVPRKVAGANADSQHITHLIAAAQSGNGDVTINGSTFKGYTRGTIVYKAYQTGNSPTLLSHTDKILNVPRIATVDYTTVALAGGVTGADSATSCTWAALDMGSDAATTFYLSYKVLVNGTVSYTNELFKALDNAAVDAGDEVTVIIRRYLVDQLSIKTYESPPVSLVFTVASADAPAPVVNRGSNSDLLVATLGEVQTLGEPVIKSHDITIGGTSVSSLGLAGYPSTQTQYALSGDEGELLTLNTKLNAAVIYTVSSGELSPLVKESTPSTLLTDSADDVTYRLASKPELTVVGTEYELVGSGTYAGMIKITLCLDSHGLEDEGVKTLVVICVQEGDIALDRTGKVAAAAFSASAGTLSYTVGPNADLSPSSTDNLGAYETHTLDTRTSPGTGVTTAVLGNLTETDRTNVYFSAEGFYTDAPLSVIAFTTSRCGLDLCTASLARKY